MDGLSIALVCGALVLLFVFARIMISRRRTTTKALRELFAHPGCQVADHADKLDTRYKSVTFSQGDALPDKVKAETLDFLHARFGPTFHVRYFTSRFLLDARDDPKLFVDVYSEKNGNIQIRLS